jgi:vitamin B12 transporter
MKTTTFLIGSGVAFYTACVSANHHDEHSQSAEQTDSIEKITIVSGKFAIPLRQIATSVSIVSQSEIEQRGYNSVADILRHEAAVAVSNSGGIGKNTALRIRGEEGFRTQLYIDGVELLDPTAPQVTPIFDDILSSHIERIEILRGPQGLVYGADAGGVVSINTFSGSDEISLGANLEVGRFDTTKLAADVGFGSELGHIFLALSDFSTDGFNAQSADTSEESDGYDNTTLHFKAGINLTENWQGQLVIRDVSGESEFDACFNSAFQFSNTCLSESENQTSRLSLRYQSDRFNHEFGFSNTDAQRDTFADGQFSFGSQGNVQKWNYAGQASFSTHHITFGGDFETEEIETSGDERNQRGVYAEFQGNWSDNLFVTAGIRHDNNDTFGTFNSVRISAAHLIPLNNDQQLKFKGTFGTGFRAPSLFEQSFNDGPFAFGAAAGLQLTQEESEGFDLGVEWFKEGAFSLGLTYFDQQISDEIIFDPVGFQGYLQIQGESTSEGFELSAEQQLSTNVELWANYTYNDTETALGDARLRRPKHLANIGSSVSLLDQRLSINGSVRLANDAVDIGNQPLDDYVTANVNIAYAINPQFKVSLRGENILNREYQEVLGFNTAGASYYLGVQYRY